MRAECRVEAGLVGGRGRGGGGLCRWTQSPGGGGLGREEQLQQVVTSTISTTV